MNKIKIILFLALFVASTGCITQKRCMEKFPPVSSTDSIYIETVKEIPVIIPGDTVKIDVPVNCPDQELVNIETAKLKQVIQILNGKLQSNTLIKPDTVIVTVTNTKEVIKEVKVSTPEKYIPKIIKIFAWIGGVCIVLFIVWIVLKYGRKILFL